MPLDPAPQGSPPQATRLLGKPQCRGAADGPWQDLPRKGAALLAQLAIDGACSRERLATLLWPGVDGDKPRANLRGLLRDLRVLAGRDLVAGGDPLELAGGVGHDLDIAPGGADVMAGELLAAHDYADLDAFGEWLALERERRRNRLKRELHERIEGLERAGHPTEAAREAESLIAIDPQDESAHRWLMRLCYQRGDRAAALAAYERCASLLRRTLDAEPAPATRALATLIEADEPLPVAAAPPVGLADVQPLRLVAREAECRIIEQAWQQRMPVCVEGEAGIGKSRLLRHLAAVQPGALLISVPHGDESSPYALLARLLGALRERFGATLPESARAELARLRPEFGPMPAHPASTRRLAEALIGALSAWADAGLKLLLIDDLDRADKPSRDLLRQAAEQRGLPLNWAFALRTGAAPPLHHAAGAHWQRLVMQPLTEDQLVPWLQALPTAPADPEAWAAALHRHVRGNPLLLTEAVRALGLVDAWRLRRPPTLRRELHALIAAAAARNGAAGVQVARHWEQAQAWLEAARAYDSAAERAFGLNARADELELRQRAAACHDRAGISAGAHAARLRAWGAMLETRPIEQASDAAAELQRTARLPSERADAALAGVRTLLVAYRYAEAADAARLALTLARGLDDPARRLRARLLLASALAGTGQQHEALALLDEHHAQVLDSGELRLRLDHHGTLGFVCANAGRFDDARRAYEAALAAAVELDDLAEAAVIAGNLAIVQSRDGDFEAALRSARSDLQLRRTLGDDSSLPAAMAQQVIGTLCLRLSRWSEALEAALQAVRLIDAVGSPRLLVAAENTLAWIWLDLGRPDLARAALSPIEPKAGSVLHLPRLMTEARLAQAEGGSVRACLESGWHGGDRRQDVHRWPFELRWSVFEEPAAALERCRAVAAQAERSGAASFALAARCAEAAALLRRGDAPAAARVMHAVLDRLEHCLPADLPMAELWCGALTIVEAGDPAAYERVLGRAWQWLHEQALPQVPAEHRESFLQRHTAVLELRERARRQGLDRAEVDR